MINRIFIIGQCTLHWGRMEFGNIGNYYIIRPMFQQLRRVFPDAELVTTMQFSDGFCREFSIETVPMELYYDFHSKDNLPVAVAEYESACGVGDADTAFLREVRHADLVIDFSGDIWGENADFLGKDRFLTGCYKDLTAQKLTKTVMIAGSPGPFRTETLDIAKKTYAGFSLVINRESISTQLLTAQGFDVSRTYDCACPSFLFEKAGDGEIADILKNRLSIAGDGPLVGFIMCGWNFQRGPFDAWPREDGEYDTVVRMLREIVDSFRARIVLLSHSNGFDIPPRPFVLKRGRDFPIVSQLYSILNKNGLGEHVTLLDGVYTPGQTKAIISHFDALISGRMHGAVAGLSQNIPTMILDYGHEPKAHKLRGFAAIAGVEDLIADPNDMKDMLEKVRKLMADRAEIKRQLTDRMKDVRKSSQKQFDFLTTVKD